MAKAQARSKLLDQFDFSLHDQTGLNDVKIDVKNNPPERDDRRQGIKENIDEEGLNQKETS